MDTQFNAFIVVLCSKGNLIIKDRCRIKIIGQQCNRLATRCVKSRLSVTKKSRVIWKHYHSLDLFLLTILTRYRRS
jgi:hypothetical protein